MLLCAANAGKGHLWSEEDEGKRAELFRGARAGKGHASAQPGVRTADDIKAAYGRSTKRWPFRVLCPLS